MKSPLIIDSATYYIHNAEKIIVKINKIIKLYSKIKSLQAYEFTQDVRVINSIQPHIIYFTQLLRLDTYEIFKISKFDKIYKNSPPAFKKNHSLYEVLYKYTAQYHTPYLYIDNFINMLLYSFPKRLDMDYFHELNLLYEKIKKCDNPTSRITINDDEYCIKQWNKLFSDNIVTRKTLSEFVLPDGINIT